MKSENQSVVADQSSQKRFIFVHISARSNLMTPTQPKASLAPPSHLWTSGPPIVVGEPHERAQERRKSDPLIYSQWAC
jgi:hypothetical protein